MSVQLLFLLGFLLCSIPPSSSESSTCLMVYKEGGAPAVYKSPKCSRWTLLADDIYRPMENCQSAMLQGRRRSQEDRTVCALDIQIPFLGRTGVEEISVGIIAVFDGHNGAEASDMASKLLLEYFLLHVYFLLDGIYSAVLKRSTERLTNKGEHDAIYQVFNLDKGHSWHNLDQERSKWMFPTVFDRPFHMEILKESLLRTIHDIDAAFSKDAFRKNLESGSTASVVLVADGQILAANVGDSKALLCSENFHHGKKGNLSKLNRRRRHKYAISSGKESNSGGPTYCVKELTEDHHPDRNDERNRVEAAGGHVVDWAGVPRVNGELAVSRSIGDVSFKSYGVISIPEVTDWQSLTSNDTYLVAATDGIFEKMTTQEVCDLLWDANIRDDVNSEFISDFTRSLADCIVNTAFERGSMDNMAAVVVPLRSTGISGTLTKDRCDLERNSGSSLYGLQNHMYIKSANVAIATSLIPMEYQNRIMSKFTRLLVETKNKRLGCFYLSENLNEDMDYVFQAPRDHQEDEVHDFSHSLSEPLGYYHSVGPLDLYSDQNLCWHFGMHNEDDRGHCTSPEVFAKFLGLLDSVSYDETSSNSSESFGQKIPNFRYTLKRRFDRGSYGEVWLAFHWNCSQDGDTLNQMHKNTTCFATHLHIDPSECNTSINSSSKQWFTDAGDDNLFILKRIMVERGNTAYLSGLREKYFGEIFLNASMSLGGLAAAGLSTAFSRESQLDASDLSEMNKSDLYGMGYVLNPTNTFPRNFRKLTASYEEGLKHIARYVESFESQSKEIWLVFRNEGLSLSKLIYTAEETKLNTSYEKNERVNNIQVLHPSAWWHWLRTTPAGKTEMRNLIWQLLTALKSCHDRNITHRDIKPENMIICFEDVDTGRCLRGIPSGEKHYPLKMRVIDFGSAIDEHSMKYLYGSGPSRSEQTFEYSPPEALLNASWFHGPKRVTLKYDMWSVGVVMLELILGSPHVFQISDRTRALLDQHLEGWSEHTKELAYKLRSYMEMCILIPGISPLHHQSSRNKDNDAVWPASWKCSEESFSNQVKSRDPLKLGFPSVWALRLVRQLLVWHPEDRLSVDDALQHPYFQPHPQT